MSIKTRPYSPGPLGRLGMNAFAFLRRLGASRFGDPSGRIQKRGRYHSHTRKGPGRRHAGKREISGAKLWRKAREGKLGMRR